MPHDHESENLQVLRWQYLPNWYTDLMQVLTKISADFFVGICESHSVMSVCDPMDYTLHGILQVKILEWIAFPFSRGSSQPNDQTQVSHTAGGFFTS